jgi:hypothetical protein
MNQTRLVWRIASADMSKDETDEIPEVAITGEIE